MNTLKNKYKTNRMTFAPKMRFFSLLTTGFLSIFVFIGLGSSAAVGSDSAVPSETVRLEYFPAEAEEAAGLFSFTTSSTSNDTFSIAEGDDSATLTTDTYTTGLDATGFGVKLTGENFDHSLGHGVEMLVQFDGERQYELHGVSAHTKGVLPSTMYVTEPISADSVETYALTITLHRNADGSSPVIDDVEIISFDASTDELPTSGSVSIAATESGMAATSATEPRILSRAEWSADEEYRNNSAGEEIWPREYADVKAFIVHHTAGGDGGSDPASTIRGIYYWHAQVLGWGDIGYNYLIDGNGVIYKGRKGKDGVIGAHTYNSVDGINYNEGSIGIALMGCFDESGCDSVDEISAKTEAALTELIGYKASELGIKPKSTVTFKGAEAKRIGGHQDFDYTLCPGSHVLGDMSEIRADAQAVYESYQAVPLQAERSGVAAFMRADLEGMDPEASIDMLNLNKKYSVVVSYENTGTETWSQGDMNLRMTKKSGKGITRLRHKKSWPHRYGKIPMNEEAVEPGGTATFTFHVKSPKKKNSRTMSMKLYSGSEYVTDSKEATTLTFTKPYAGELTEHTLPAAVFAGSSQEVSFTFANDGISSWGGDVIAKLDGQEVGGFADTIAPGETGVITTTVNAGSRGQVQEFKIVLKKNGKKVAGTKEILASRVD